jgi:hypothetical protein
MLFILSPAVRASGLLLLVPHRPLSGNDVTDDTGVFRWMGNPAAMLVNGKGNQHDCNETQVTNGTRVRLLLVLTLSTAGFSCLGGVLQLCIGP